MLIVKVMERCKPLAVYAAASVVRRDGVEDGYGQPWLDINVTGDHGVMIDRGSVDVFTEHGALIQTFAFSE